MDEVIKLALQESNDIESHYGHKVNGLEDLIDSLLAWEFLCDRELNLNIEDVKTAHWIITRRQLPVDERGTLRSSNGIEVTIGGRNGLSSRNCGKCGAPKSIQKMVKPAENYTKASEPIQVNPKSHHYG